MLLKLKHFVKTEEKIVVFSSIEFIFIFLPIFLLLYHLVPKKLENLVMLVGSAVFIAYGMWDDPIQILFLAMSVLVNYFIANIISMSDGKGKLWLIIGIAYNFIRLILYKYTDFIITSINDIFGTYWATLDMSMPMGISFYTFCAAAYLVDVYRKKITAERSVIAHSAYMLNFTKFISGPITRYPLEKKRLNFVNFDDGLREFIVGLGLKVLIANRLSGVWNGITTIGYESVSTPLAWMGILSYSLQLYFDFYGYSLMALGIGRMLGFELPKNFDHPYASRSMTEFWRRWHMTLGAWFRDYVYIPLGGSRKGWGFTILNTLIVWLFTGIWHGAGGNYIIWGLFLFVLIIIEKLFLKKTLDRIKPLGHLYMLLIIPISWLPFAIGNLGDMLAFFGRLFPFFGEGINVFHGDFAKYFSTYGVAFIAGLILCLPFGRKLFDRYKKSIVVSILLTAVFCASIYFIYKGGSDPFMYFNF